MSPRTLLDHFDLLAEAPGGIARLRELVLHLAVRGKLVAQDPADEPASKLLKRIAKERARLVKEGKIRAGKTLPPVGAEEAPFEVPAGWVWTLVQNVGDIKLGRQRSPQNHLGPFMVPYLRVANVKEAELDLRDVKRMNFTPDEQATFGLKRGDVLLNEGQSLELVGRPALYSGEVPGACFQNTLIRVRCHGGCLAEYALAYFRHCLHSGRFQEAAQRTTNIAHLSASRLAVIEFPLPPLAEQHRIVARVEELMALLDRLEAARGARDTARLAARDSALAALRDAADADEVAAAWRRLEAQMDNLFQAPEDVPPLRQAILQLAVRGRLVAQKPEDEPASELLKRIASERARLVKKGKIRAGKTLPPVGDDEVPFEVPEGWVWAPVVELAGPIVDGTHHTPRYVPAGIPFVSAKDIVDGCVTFSDCRYISEAEFHELSRRCCPRRGNVLVTKSGSIGRVAVVETDAKFTLFESVALIPLLAPIVSRYVATVVGVQVAGAFGNGKTKGAAVQHLHLKDLRTLPVPLPPLAEQHRIVARVDELMALCDRLESRLAAAREAQTALAAAAVHHIAQPDFAA